MTRLIIAGVRTFDDYELLKSKADEVVKDLGEVEIVSGHAKGADMLGERYAAEHAIPCTLFPAEWERYGRAAGPVRNGQMIEYAKQETPMLLCFWDGVAHGTRNIIQKAEREGIQTIVVRYDQIEPAK